MSSDMLKAAEAEVQRLEAELATAQKKLHLAKQVVELYRADQRDTFVILPKPVPKTSPASKALNSAVQTAVEFFEKTESLTKTARIERAATKYLRRKGARATSGELLQAVIAEGIEITGKEPGKALSAYLSTSKCFNNLRELGGYGLVEWGSSKGPDLLTGVK